MMIFRLALLAFLFLLPLVCLIRGQHRALLFWLGLSSMIDILSSQMFLSISAVRAAGVVLFPYVLMHLKPILRTKPGKVLAAVVAYMALLLLWFGYVHPWADVTEMRGFRHLAQGRSIIYFGSWSLELVVAMYLAIQLKARENFRPLFQGFLLGAVLTSVGALLEKFCRFDFYYFFTGWDKRELSSRTRGFNYEPRGLGYASTVGLLFLLLPQARFPKRLRLALIIATCVGFHYAASVGAAILLITGALIYIALTWTARRKFPGELTTLLQSCACIAITIFVLTKLIPSYAPGNTGTKDAWEYVIESKTQAHLNARLKWGERLEVFDALAVRFLQENPIYVVSGVGPGLISLPMSTPDLRVDSVPHSGVVMMISNYGLIGVALWLAMMALILMGTKQFAFSSDPSERAMLMLFLALMVIHFLQYKVFYIFGLGSGLALYLTPPAAAITPRIS